MVIQLDKFHKFYEGQVVAKDDHELLSDNICPACLEPLPEPVWESREGGYSEQVIYCSCGATYTS